MSESAHADVHPHAAELRNADGSWKYANALVDQTSPYLLQHAHNPVDWRPWGQPAFDAAAREGKPIFLSVGYSTCYWCHVMERQVFENPAIAKVMNEHFINVKVDREERPDVDDIYMHAVHVMGQQGGWPMSVFLTPPGASGDDDPGLKPFFAGTYFPPQDMHGRPGFPKVLAALRDAWTSRRDEVTESADRIAQAVRHVLGRETEPRPVTARLIADAANAIFQSYDREHGGFGSAPKFPVPNNLLLLMAVYGGNPQDELWAAIAHTLDRMARGGMYDQIGGGFHRYSTDARWLVPHFEKMLYDNGQLLEVYATAHQLQPDPKDPTLYRRVVEQTCDYVIREMTDATGAFWSAQDAEVDAAEGANYLWTEHEVRASLHDPRLSDIAMRMYGLDRGTNFRDPHLPDARPTNVLYMPERYPDIAASLDLSLDQLTDARRKIDPTLLATRDQRKQPGTDDKVLVAWNGMMISGMALAGATFDRPDWIEAAGRAARAILTHMRDDLGGLLRSMRGGEAGIPAFLEDYAFFIAALVALHHATGEGDWLDVARELAEQVEQRFAAPGGGYFDTLPDQRDLFVRTRTSHDGAVSGANSQMVHALLDLHEAAGDATYIDRAARSLRSFAGELEDNGRGMSHMAHAALRALSLAPAAFATDARDEQDQPADAPRVMAVEVAPEQVDLRDGEAQVVVTLRLGRGYHINAHEPGVDGLHPTRLELRDGRGVTLDVAYPPGREKVYPFADAPLSVYEGEVQLTATLKADPTAQHGAPSDARLILHCQICTDQSCLTPREDELPLRIRG